MAVHGCSSLLQNVPRGRSYNTIGTPPCSRVAARTTRPMASVLPHGEPGQQTILTAAPGIRRHDRSRVGEALPGTDFGYARCIWRHAFGAAESLPCDAARRGLYPHIARLNETFVTSGYVINRKGLSPCFRFPQDLGVTAGLALLRGIAEPQQNHTPASETLTGACHHIWAYRNPRDKPLTGYVNQLLASKIHSKSMCGSEQIV